MKFLCAHAFPLLWISWLVVQVATFDDKVFVRFNDSLYLLNRGRRQLLALGDIVKEAQTVEAFGGDIKSVLNISYDALSRYPLHSYAVPYVHKMDESPDELMRFHVLKV